MVLMAGSVAAAPAEESKLERFMAADGKWAWREIGKAKAPVKAEPVAEPAEKPKAFSKKKAEA